MTFDVTVTDSIIANIEGRADTIVAALAGVSEMQALQARVTDLQAQLDATSAQRDTALAENAAAEQKIAEWSSRLQAVVDKIAGVPAAG